MGMSPDTDDRGTASTADRPEQPTETEPSDGTDRIPAVTPLDSSDEQPSRQTGPLEPQMIDPENAAFVLLGVGFVGGLLVATLAGL
jgi:hypothetical protein